MKLTEFCKVLDDNLAEAVPETIPQIAASAMQQAFKVADDEVASLKINPETASLQFIWPAKLARAGSIPLKSRDSLAANTVRDQRPVINNRFSSTIHASVFEQVRLDNPRDKQPQRPQIIQKIMSVPLIDGETVIGAAQVCRKGETAEQGGAGFTPVELDAFAEIAKVISRHL